MEEFKSHTKNKKLISIIVFIMVFALTGISSVGAAATMAPATTTIVKRGDTGSAVTEIQTRLKNWDYYKYIVDGIFGKFTQEAVIAFQKKNNIAADGIVGPITAAKMGINLSKFSVTSSSGTTTTPSTTTTQQSTTSSNAAVQGDVLLLAKLVYAEARGEVYRGKVAVAAVVLNRVDDARFPNTISGVIYQPKQFTCVSNGAINNTPDAECLKAARDALNGVDPSGGAVFFFNSKTTSSTWNATRKVITTIGNHTFTE